jgi:osmotically-inducible protein OsmY
MMIRLASAVVMAAALAAPAAAETDDEVRRSAESAILGYVHYGVFDSVSLGVKDGHVVLEGSVTAGHRKDDLEERVAAVSGVRSVTSHIKVQSGSPFDDQLRLRVYRAVYGTNRLIPFPGVNPPVRIVVDGGRITLTGYVGSEVLRMAIGAAARETNAFDVKNELVLDGEKVTEPTKSTDSYL